MSLVTLFSGLHLHGTLFMSVIGGLLSGPAAALGVCGFCEGSFMLTLFVQLSGSVMSFCSGLMIFSGFCMTGARHGNLLFAF
jgi:hypothetical protein